MKNKVFTIVEMLIAISLLAILMSLLQPALKNALKQSQLVTCKNNLRQIGILLESYSGDHLGHFAPRSVNGVQGLWIKKLLELEFPNQPRNLFKVNPVGTIFECPTSDKVGENLSPVFQGGYGYNGQAGDFRVPPRFEFKDTTKLITDVTQPSQTAIFGDDKPYSTGGPGYLNTQLLSHPWAENHPRIRHDYAANYTWADGHVSLYLWDEFVNDGIQKGHKDWFLKFEK